MKNEADNDDAPVYDATAVRPAQHFQRAAARSAAKATSGPHDSALIEGRRRRTKIKLNRRWHLRVSLRPGERVEILDEDVARLFPTNEAVNVALREAALNKKKL